MDLRLDRLRAAVEEEAMAREDVLIMVVLKYAGVRWAVETKVVEKKKGSKRSSEREGMTKAS